MTCPACGEKLLEFRDGSSHVAIEFLTNRLIYICRCGASWFKEAPQP